jgi:hypothetical protein
MVVIMTALIFTTATAMIALVTTDYKNRITNSRRLENMYGTDAEVDVVYNSIVKNCDAAIVYANHRAKIEIDNIEDKSPNVSNSYDRIYDQVNLVYKKAFIEFLNSNNSTGTGLNNPAAFDQVTQRLVYGIINRRYVVPASTGVSDTELATINSTTAYPWIVNSIEGTKDSKQNAEFTINSFDKTNTDTTNQIVIGISSTFTSTGNVDDMTNKRTVSMKFKINAPDYNQPIGNETTNAETQAYPIEKALVTDGNLNVNNGITSVDGDIWVKGKNINYSGKYAYDKYKSGIFVKNGSELYSINGNILTASTINVQDHSIVAANNDVLSLNTYIGPTDKGGTDNPINDINNIFVVNGKLVTNNDLTMNSKKSDAFINSYYGINANTTPENFVTLSDDDGDGETNGGQASRSSSSIIVNEHEGSHLEIQNDVYVAGVSYIEMESSFKSGESVGVKGNYVAYSDVLPNGDKVTFKDYNPLTLVENKIIMDAQGKEKEEPMKTSEKAKYFNDFFANNSDKLDDGGIIFDHPENLFTVGAYVYGREFGSTDKEFGSKGTAVLQQDGEERLKTLRKYFAKQVFAMGGVFKDTSGNIVDDLDLYNGNKVENTVENQIDWINKDEFIPRTASEIKLDDAFGKFIFNKDATRDITITNSGILIDGKLIDARISTKGDGKQYALIVTKGKVNIQGDNVQFRGCIIAEDDINVDGAGSKDIVYDRDAVLSIKASYGDKADIFLGDPIAGTNTNKTVSTGVRSSTIQNEPYDANTYLQKGLWRLEK